MRIPVPEPRPDDGVEVCAALATAASYYRNSEFEHSLSWLGRAASAASEAGRSARARELAAALAQLRDVLGGAATDRGGSVSATLASFNQSSRDAPTSERSSEPIPSTARATYPSGTVPLHSTPTPSSHTTVSLQPNTLPAAQLRIDLAGHQPQLAALTGVGAAPLTPAAATPSAAASSTRSSANSSAAARSTLVLDDLPEFAGTQPSPPKPSDTTQGAPQPLRVALLEAADGGDVRVVLVPDGVPMPEGAAGALLLPLDGTEQRRIRAMLRKLSKP